MHFRSASFAPQQPMHCNRKLRSTFACPSNVAVHPSVLKLMTRVYCRRCSSCATRFSASAAPGTDSACFLQAAPYCVCIPHTTTLKSSWSVNDAALPCRMESLVHGYCEAVHWTTWCGRDFNTHSSDTCPLVRETQQTHNDVS